MIDLINPISFYNQQISSYSQHTFLGVVTEGIPALVNYLESLVNQVALNVIGQVVISLALFYLNHNVFILGVFIGFVFDEQVREVVKKVDIVYKAQKTFLDRALFFGVGGFLTLYHMPHALIATTLYHSSQWGALFFQNSKNRYAKVAHQEKKGEL